MSSTPANIGIQHLEQDDRGAFVVEREEIRLAEMTYVRSRAEEPRASATRVSGRRIIIDHTLVDERLRGHGVARKLLDTLVTWARETDTRVLATCPYAIAQFAKDPSIQDVYDGAP